MIAKSKKFKYERQKEKEQLLNEFEKFDEEFKAIRSLTKDFDRTADQKVSFNFWHTSVKSDNPPI